MITNHETMRKKLWIETFVALASAPNCLKPDIASDWANKAVDDFDKKFGREDRESNFTLSILKDDGE